MFEGLRCQNAQTRSNDETPLKLATRQMSDSLCLQPTQNISRAPHAKPLTRNLSLILPFFGFFLPICVNSIGIL